MCKSCLELYFGPISLFPGLKSKKSIFPGAGVWFLCWSGGGGINQVAGQLNLASSAPLSHRERHHHHHNHHHYPPLPTDNVGWSSERAVGKGRSEEEDSDGDGDGAFLYVTKEHKWHGWVAIWSPWLTHSGSLQLRAANTTHAAHATHTTTTLFLKNEV